MANMTEIVSRFAISKERIQILQGLINYRLALAKIGIMNGWQWIDGSFVEDCEIIRKRAPDDVDLVTFAYRPVSVSATPAWNAFFQQNINLFDFNQTKAQYKCDAYYVDLHKPPHLIVNETAYFNSLFSHQRDTALWKGMIITPLKSDDDAAAKTLEGLVDAKTA